MLHTGLGSLTLLMKEHGDGKRVINSLMAIQIGVMVNPMMELLTTVPLKHMALTLMENGLMMTAIKLLSRIMETFMLYVKFLNKL